MNWKRLTVIVCFALMIFGCQRNETQKRLPFAEAEALVCPQQTRRVEVRETSYPEFYCVGDEGRTGEWLEFDVAGRLRKRAYYAQGKLNGPWISYHESGMIESRGQMQNDGRTGLWHQFYLTGTPRSDKTYDNNQLHGPLVLYYKSGNKMAEGQYLKGVEDGPWKVYAEDGRLARECILVNGNETDCKVYIEDFKPSTYMYDSKELGPL